jgi:hypothetical protein
MTKGAPQSLVYSGAVRNATHSTLQPIEWLAGEFGRAKQVIEILSAGRTLGPVEGEKNMIEIEVLPRAIVKRADTRLRWKQRVIRGCEAYFG